MFLKGYESFSESSRSNENYPGFAMLLSRGRRLGYIGAKPTRTTTSQAKLSQRAVPSGFVFRGTFNSDFGWRQIIIQFL
jgi:hypothetical protein